MDKVRFFVDDGDDGYGPYYAGDADNIPAAMKAIGCFAEQAFRDLAENPDGEEKTFTVSARRMSDEEVASLPDV